MISSDLTHIRKLVADITIESQKVKKKIAFVFVTTAKPSSLHLIILPKRKTPHLICAAVTVYNKKIASTIAKEIDGKVDFIIIDSEQKVKGLQNLTKSISQNVSKSKLLTFKNNDSTADSTDSLIVQLLNFNYKKKVGIIGAGNIGSKVALKLVERGMRVYVSRSTMNDARKIANAINMIKPKYCKGKAIPKNSMHIAKNVHMLIGFSSGVPSITSKTVNQMQNGSMILDGGIGTLSEDAIKVAQMKKIRIIRIDARMGFAGAITTVIETSNLIEKIMGYREYNGIKIVAGGFYGNYGDIVVDSISEPKEIIGIANGKGGIMQKIPQNMNVRMRIAKKWMSEV